MLLRGISHRKRDFAPPGYQRLTWSGREKESGGDYSLSGATESREAHSVITTFKHREI